MTHAQGIRGSIPAIVRNDAQLYEGNLIYYFRMIFNHARNLDNPYHNFGHLFYVMWRCHQACDFYQKTLSRRAMRTLLIAAMLHDVDHTGKAVPDSVNIARAIGRLREYAAPEDENELPHIFGIMRGSEYPYRYPSEEAILEVQILRDADVSQMLSPTWIQHAIFGLAAERNKTPHETLEEEVVFLRHLKFHTSWARKLFPAHMTIEKLGEAQELLELLENEHI